MHGHLLDGLDELGRGRLLRVREGLQQAGEPAPHRLIGGNAPVERRQVLLHGVAQVAFAREDRGDGVEPDAEPAQRDDAVEPLDVRRAVAPMAGGGAL